MRLPCVLALGLAACGFHGPAGAGADGGTRAVTITDDTAADFATPAPLGDTVIASRGALEPDAFVLAGLRARGFVDDHVSGKGTWPDVISDLGAAVPTGVAYGQVPTDWSYDRPRGLGLYRGDYFTVLYDGEVQLPDGTQALDVDVDDSAITEVELDGVWQPAQVGSGKLTLHPTHAGWYPIRVAYAESGGSAHLHLGSGGSDLPPSRLRARVGAAQGLLGQAFTGQGLNTAVGTFAVPEPLTFDHGTNAPPYDFDPLGNNTLSLRFAGQVRIDQAGTYQLRADVGGEQGDGYRIWLDGKLVAGLWGGATLPSPSAPLDLGAGWHSLLVDYSQYQGTSKLALLVSGPAGAPERPLPAAWCRPAAPFGATASFYQTNGVTLVDAVDGAHPGVASLTVNLDAPPGAIIDAVDVGFFLTHSNPSDVTASLLAPTLPPDPLPIGPTTAYDYTSGRITNAGQLAHAETPWLMRFVDAVHNNSNGFVQYPLVALTYHGGPAAPFATTFTYTSAPKPTPGAVRLGAIHATADLAGATLTLAVRVADDAAGLDAAPWTVTPDGAAPTVAPGALVQYQLTVTGDGWQFPTIDKVELSYDVAP